MAIFVVPCTGSQWQDDFTPLVPRLYSYFTAVVARSQVLDPEELRHKCVLRFMHRFMNLWAPGKVLRIATSFIVWHAKAGRDILPKAENCHRRSVKTRRLGHVAHKPLKSRPDRKIERIDFKDMLERLSSLDRVIVELYVEGWKWREIMEQASCNEHHIRDALRRAVNLLNR